MGMDLASKETVERVPGVESPDSNEGGWRKRVPWWAKIVIKVGWSRLPIRYDFWKRIGIFRHGFMESADYVSDVFLTHWNRSQFARKSAEFYVMELGCGDSLASCLMGNAVGASGYYLVDVGEYAAKDIGTYKRIASELSGHARPRADISTCVSVPEMLASVNARYLTHGLESLKGLPDKSVDFIWSQAVLEHIRKGEFAETMRELRRILRDDGVMSHRIDLMDHLGGALNNLRFTTRLWESPLMTRSGFYTNRIRFGEMISVMSSAGFHVDIVKTDRWRRLPTSRRKLLKEFQSLPDGDLLVQGFDAVLRPN